MTNRKNVLRKYAAVFCVVALGNLFVLGCKPSSENSRLEQVEPVVDEESKPTMAEGRAANHPFRISLSVSPFTNLMIASGVTFTDGKRHARTDEELQRLFVAQGATEVYARIATKRTSYSGASDHSLEHGLARARLAKELGLPFNPELGLFEIYGDVQLQPSPDFSEYPEIDVPGPWETLTLDQMLPPLRKYGEVVARQILDTGVRVNVWDIGNEVDYGFAGVALRPDPEVKQHPEDPDDWYIAPDNVDPEIGNKTRHDLRSMPRADRIAWLEKHVWPYMSRMLAAVGDGIRDADPDARFSTHIVGTIPLEPEMALAFYRAMKEGGFLPDELGLSFYPTAGLPQREAVPPNPHLLNTFRETVETLREEFDRPVFIAEFGYPAELMKEGPFASWNYELQDYPLTPKGQADLFRDLTSWGATAGLSGIRPWGPDFAAFGWEPMSLFRSEGKTAIARPSIQAMVEGLESPNPNVLRSGTLTADASAAYGGSKYGMLWSGPIGWNFGADTTCGTVDDADGRVVMLLPAVNGAEDVTVSCWINTQSLPAEESLLVLGITLNSDDLSLISSGAATVAGGSDWTRATVVVAGDEGGSANDSLVIHLAIDGNAGRSVDGTLLIDDVSVVDSTGELLKNGGFEDGTLVEPAAGDAAWWQEADCQASGEGEG